MLLTILEGSTFAISDELGDIVDGVHGLYADDTRLLSRSRLLVEGVRPLLLTSQVVEYFDSAHYLRNAPTDGLGVDSLSIARERFVGETLTERFVVRNETPGALSVTLGLELASDFADILSVKAHDFALGDPARAEPLPSPVRPTALDSTTLELRDPATDWSTHVVFSQPARLADGTATFEVKLEPRQSWELFSEASRGDRIGERTTPRFGRERQHVRDSLSAWRLRVPRLDAEWGELERCYERSLSDLAALRLRGPEWSHELPAAGMPWFMTLFGRDTLITSLQTLLFGPELAVGALRALAALQAHGDDGSIDAEPGKILHELRRGKAATAWFPLYYGTVDATPLFLVVLSEVWRWTGDDELVRELEPAARAALTWVERYGDLDGDGFVEYRRRSGTGLLNQGWKDSDDSVFHEDGSLADAPIALCEVQAYVYLARTHAARLAHAFGEEAMGRKLEVQARELRERFERHFWCEELGTYALALDGRKRPCRVRSSNVGHVLWSGIASEERARRAGDTLMSPQSFSGWGLRTIAQGEPRYNPMSYHNGSIWPHDNALAAMGLARYGMKQHTALLATALYEASLFMDLHRLPELFCGFERRNHDEGPTLYPVACSPQAWASATAFYLIKACLGLSFRLQEPRIRFLHPVLPRFLDRLRLVDLRVRDAVVDVQFERHGDEMGVQVTRKEGGVEVSVVL